MLWYVIWCHSYFSSADAAEVSVWINYFTFSFFICHKSPYALQSQDRNKEKYERKRTKDLKMKYKWNTRVLQSVYTVYWQLFLEIVYMWCMLNQRTTAIYHLMKHKLFLSWYKTNSLIK